MSVSWKSVPFNTVYSIPSRNGIYKSKEFHGSGFKVINMGELFRYEFISSQDMKRVELNEVEKKNYAVSDGDLLFARRSVVENGSGKCSLVINPSETTVFESSIIRVRLNTLKVDPKFYFYYFKSYQGRGLVLSISTGVNVKGIRGSDLRNLPIPLPPLPIQRKIAGILSAYDDLIENNTRRIAILEEMAQRIYKEWFVDFKYPGHENDKLVDSGTEFGMIPEGWEVKSIESFGKVVTGKTPSKKLESYYGKDIPFIKTPDMHGNIFCINTNECLSIEGSESQAHKLLPRSSLIVSCIGTAGIVSIVAYPSHTNQQINALLPNNNNIREYLYFSLLSLKDTIQLYGATGATMVNLSKGKFEKLKIVKPHDTAISDYHSFSKPLFNEILTLQKKQAVLRKTRDLLLPKLISGQIDVSELDIDIGDLDD